MLYCNVAIKAEPSPAPDYSDLTTGTNPESRRVVKLQVPLVRQPQAKLCGPAVIEMLFRYWGETRYNQYDIARAMVIKYHLESGRFRDSEILREVRAHSTNSAVNWKRYPGTGTYQMREFLEAFAPTVNPRVKQLPDDEREAVRIRDRFFRELKGHLDSGSPAIVHQWFNEGKESMHYRVVTGYDDVRRVVFMNDPAKGLIEMPYELFLELWNVQESWLPYNYIVFNRYAPGRVDKGKLRIELVLDF
tara:strand:+ start:59055 stop:59795 length:741 start_codon:yes stop_codon:yes gene_type:complete